MGAQNQVLIQGKLCRSTIVYSLIGLPVQAQEILYRLMDHFLGEAMQDYNCLFSNWAASSITGNSISAYGPFSAAMTVLTHGIVSEKRNIKIAWLPTRWKGRICV
ncbi:unnamed protein product [Urochloa humidicola]